MTNSLYIAASAAPREALGMDKVYLAYVAGAIRTRRVFDVVELTTEFKELLLPEDVDEVGLRSYVAGFVSNEAARLVSEARSGGRIELVNGNAEPFLDVEGVIVPVHDFIAVEVKDSIESIVRKDFN